MSVWHRISSWIEGEEEVLTVFPTFAMVDESSDTLFFDVHAWVFEPELGSASRQTLLAALRKLLDFEEGTPEAELFRKRVAPFLVDNERWQKLRARIGGRVYEIGRSGADGHVHDFVTIPWSHASTHVVEENGRKFVEAEFFIDSDSQTERIEIVEPEGMTVISDVDDTIKHTGVLDHREMLTNTFLRPFRPVEGMADLYAEWRDAGARFHYVSAGPWQLLPFLQNFLDRFEFPEGVFHLRKLRVKSLRSPAEFVSSSRGYKVETISGLFDRFPRRRFTLVGDSGENDPEVYGEVARSYPEQVESVLIRQVEGAANAGARFEEAFADLDPALWKLR